jgi:hypothetical protein
MHAEHRDSEPAANGARLIMLEEQTRQLSAMVRGLTAENDELRRRLGLGESIPDAAGMSGATHLEWMRVVVFAWRQRLTAIGERNRALSEVEHLTATVRRLEEEARQREEIYQTQVQELLTK